MTLTSALTGLLLFPGLLYAVPMAWLMEWINRKLVARLQRRIGPPFYQPFFDFVKLLAKEPVSRPPLQGFVMTALPLIAIASTLGTIALLPIFPSGHGFTGDLVLLVSLVEVAPLCAVLAGFASRSLFGGIGATREAVLTLAYNLPFLTALFALAVGTGSFSLAGLVSTPIWFVRVPALIALLITLPVKLHLNPFSAASAEQEIYAGATTEYDGPRLALWELSHALEWVVLTGLWAVTGVSGAARRMADPSPRFRCDVSGARRHAGHRLGSHCAAQGDASRPILLAVGLRRGSHRARRRTRPVVRGPK